jgi:MFS family permease
MTPASPSQGAFAPFLHRTFTVIWVASVVGSIGTWMRDVASGWLMTSLSPSPVMVALVQAAGVLPSMLLALPAGALADLVDRRRLLLAVQVALAAISLTLAVLAASGMMTSVVLLALVLAGGAGAALAAPAWQTSVPELVPRSRLRAAVALNSMGFNVSRAIGPALGGLVLTTAGTAATYLADALSYLVVIAALLWWRPAARHHDSPREALPGAMRAGLRYAWHAPPLRRVLSRACVFFIFGAAHWALLPLLARQVLGGGAELYGLMLAGIGVGAVTGALVLPWLRRRLGTPDRLMFAGAVVLALGQSGMALSSTETLAVAMCLLSGMAWIAVLSTLNAIAQAVLPDWVRGRGLALYLTVVSGAMALGSLGWGQVAAMAGVPVALLLAAGGGTLTAIAVRALPLPDGEGSLLPSAHWAAPMLPAADATGPVLVLVAYTVAPERQTGFRKAIAPLGRIRRRDGAIAWGIGSDLAEPGRMVEWFLLASWADHLRQHAHVTHQDKAVQEAVKALNESATPPAVTHILGAVATRHAGG